MSDPASPTTAPHVWRWMRLVVGIALLVALVFLVDVRSTLQTLAEVRWPYLVLLLAINTGAYLVFAMRWSYFCRRLGLHLPRGGYLRGVYLFQITSQVMPSSLLGEAGRFAVFGPEVRKRDVVKSIALDRLSNQVALVVCITLFAPYYVTLDLPAWWKWCLPLPAIVLVVVYLVARGLAKSPRLERLRFLRLLVEERLGMRPVLLGLLLCAVLALEFQVAALALPVSAPLTLGLLVPLLTLALALAPISMGDWGTREVLAVVFLGTTGLATEDVVAVSILVGITNLLASLPGLYFVVRGRRDYSP